jgi:hypothetical protein
MRFKHAVVHRYKPTAQDAIIQKTHQSQQSIPLHTITNHTSNLYPSISNVLKQPASSVEDDNVSLHTKDLIINCVKQIPSKVYST